MRRQEEGQCVNTADGEGGYFRGTDDWEMPGVSSLETDERLATVAPSDGYSPPKREQLRIESYQKLERRHSPVQGLEYQLSCVGSFRFPASRWPNRFLAVFIRAAA